MLNEKAMLARMAAKEAVILSAKCEGGSYIAVPKGDRRRRPVAWINKDMIKRWLADGIIIKKYENYELVPSFEHRMGQTQRYGARAAHGHQHRDMKPKTVFNPDGLRRTVLVNGFASVFQRLARQENADGKPFLYIDEIEAGERFAADYAKSMMGALAAQNYAGVGGAAATRINSAENVSVQVIDARRKVAEALVYVGPGLDKVLTALCGREWSLAQIETEQGWSRSSGRTVLKLALARLSIYYGCKAGVKMPAKEGPINQVRPVHRV